jgi:hypothetical protein
MLKFSLNDSILFFNETISIFAIIDNYKNFTRRSIMKLGGSPPVHFNRYSDSPICGYPNLDTHNTLCYEPPLFRDTHLWGNGAMGTYPFPKCRSPIFFVTTALFVAHRNDRRVRISTCLSQRGKYEHN